MKIQTINFPDELLQDIRDNKLVIFAGSGISMGAPANLPDFNLLAEKIASGSGETRPSTEQSDRFLGRLKGRGVEVHQLAASALTLTSASFTPLHKNILRIFSSVDDVRIVTTNFDTLFNEALKNVFDKPCDIYEAPALPLGHDFSGIVHVHGSRLHLKGMVLTDADFGKAYLTEGWARRFLVSLFKNFTVLFVGYSHDDVVMHYLSRALPQSETGRRYALISNDINQSEWMSRGIKPIIFEKQSSNDYRVLNQGIKELADYLSRSILDWKHELTALASVKPPSDTESEHQILDALQDESKARFFVKAARDREWLEWLDARGIFDGLFLETPLDAKQSLLAQWLADNFTADYSDDLILIIAKHGMNLNSYFWWSLGMSIAAKRKEPINLPKWISVLLDTIKGVPDAHIMESLAERCTEIGESKSLLRIFLTMISSRTVITEGNNWYEEKQTDSITLGVKFSLASNHWHLKEVFDKYITPILNDIAVPLLKGSVSQLEQIHNSTIAWNVGDRNGDSISYLRSAIEPHEQDEKVDYAEYILIDAARDSLILAQKNNLITAQSFFEDYSKSDSPILRRLAIYALSERQDINENEKLELFLKSNSLHDIAAHHETYQLVRKIYPKLKKKNKIKIIDEVFKYKSSNKDTQKAEDFTAYEHYRWFHWIRETNPKCALINKAKKEILKIHPDFTQNEHPDLTHWSSSVKWVGLESPFTVDKLLSKAPSKFIDQLLTFEGDEIRGSGRDGLLKEIIKVVRKNPSWGFELASELCDKNNWDSDLWGSLITVWQEWPADEDVCKTTISWLARTELYKAHSYKISGAIFSLVKDGGKDCALTVLSDVNSIAKCLWENAVVDSKKYSESNNDWLQFAINETPGVLAEYWYCSLNIWWKAQDVKPDNIPIEYSGILESLINEESPAGGIALCLFASQLSYFLFIDEDWTKKNILPWFDHDKDSLRMQQCWDGFLTWGTLNQRVFDSLRDFFIKATNQLKSKKINQRDRFSELYAVMVVFYEDEPQKELLQVFFKNSEPTDRHNLAIYIEHMISGLSEEQQKEQWNKWLKDYWQKRLQGIPLPLDDSEIKEMLEWLTQLTAVFPEAVELAIQMRKAKFDHVSIGYSLREGELVDRYPNDVAKILIYILELDCPSYIQFGIQEVINKLRKANLPSDIWASLEETATKYGVIE